MFLAKKDFFFGDRSFKEGDEVPIEIITERLKDLGLVGFKEDPKPTQSTKKKVKAEKTVLIDESSKIEVSKED